MATRFYLDPTLVAPFTPGFAAWTRTSEGVRRQMGRGRYGTAMSSLTTWANAAAAANASSLLAQFSGPPMMPGIAFATTDTIKGYIRCMESAANDNVNRLPICLKVYAQDGTTLQATLKALGHIGPNTTEWISGTLTNKTMADGDVLDANYTTVFGDFLVLEIGAQVSGAGGSSVTATMSVGSSSATDLGENETDTAANNPWFEISRDIQFVDDAFLGYTRRRFMDQLLPL